ncbi:pyrophosphoryl-undecaprenol N-acetylglucosamine transferase, partial [Dissostichus eleginoides]
ECNHPPCGLAASFNPSRNAFFNAKPSFIKCGCKQNPKRLTVERDEAHSVTKAESVLSQGYEQLPSVFRKGMPSLQYAKGGLTRPIPLRAANTFLHLLPPSRRLLIRSLQGAHTLDSTLV